MVPVFIFCQGIYFFVFADSGYSHELCRVLRTFELPQCQDDEQALCQQFEQPDPNRKWREGVIKSSFNYLLLDRSFDGYFVPAWKWQLLALSTSLALNQCNLTEWVICLSFSYMRFMTYETVTCSGFTLTPQCTKMDRGAGTLALLDHCNC